MGSQERSLSRSPELSVKQQKLVDTLRMKEKGDLKIADWYLGALHAFANQSNPDRIAQAAHSLRELLAKIPRIFATEQFSVTGGDLRNRRTAIQKKLTKLKKGDYKNVWMGKKINTPLSNALQDIECYLILNNHPTRSDQIKSGDRTPFFVPI